MLEEYGVGLWNITDVLEFPSTLMEQRTLDARGVLWKKLLLSPGSNEYPLLESNSEFFVLLEPYSEFFEK